MKKKLEESFALSHNLPGLNLMEQTFCTAMKPQVLAGMQRRKARARIETLWVESNVRHKEEEQEASESIRDSPSDGCDVEEIIKYEPTIDPLIHEYGPFVVLERIDPDVLMMWTKVKRETSAKPEGCDESIGHQIAVEKVAYKCETCGKSFARRWYFERHLENHVNRSNCLVEKGPHKCNFCKKEIAIKWNFNRHRKSHILEIVKDKKRSVNEGYCLCDHSGNIFRRGKKSIPQFKLHHEVVDCDFCHRKFNKSDLKNHLRLQHQDRYFLYRTCDHCGYKTKNKGHLQRHLIIHMKFKFGTTEATLHPFNPFCEICGKSVTHLKHHIAQVHTKEPLYGKTFDCRKCNITFTRLNDWRT